jgi:hypothetical protein
MRQGTCTPWEEEELLQGEHGATPQQTLGSLGVPREPAAVTWFVWLFLVNHTSH